MTDNPVHNPFAAPRQSDPASKPLHRAPGDSMLVLLTTAALLATICVPVTLAAELVPGLFTKPEAPFFGMFLHFAALLLLAVWVGHHPPKKMLLLVSSIQKADSVRSSRAAAAAAMAALNVFSWSLYIVLLHFLSHNGLRLDEFLLLVGLATGSFLVDVLTAAVMLPEDDTSADRD